VMVVQLVTHVKPILSVVRQMANVNLKWAQTSLGMTLITILALALSPMNSLTKLSLPHLYNLFLPINLFNPQLKQVLLW